MNIIGFNFTKISAERKRPVVGKVSINNNIKIREIKDAKIGIGEGDRQAVRVSFSFVTEYQPDMATLQMEGEVLGLLDKKRAQEIVSGWEKEKKMSTEIAQKLMNHILERCNIQGLLLAKDLNLPSPVPLPKVNAGVAGAPAPADAKKDDKAKKKK